MVSRQISPRQARGLHAARSRTLSGRLSGSDLGPTHPSARGGSVGLPDLTAVYTIACESEIHIKRGSLLIERAFDGAVREPLPTAQARRPTPLPLRLSPSPRSAESLMIGKVHILKSRGASWQGNLPRRVTCVARSLGA